VYPSIGTLIGIGQKNSLNFVFTDFGVVENFFVLRSSSRLNKIWLEVFIIPLLIYFIAFYLYIMLTCQAKYIYTIHRTNMLEAKPAKSHSPSGLKLSKFDGDPLPDLIEYRQLVGALQYCTLTRPDISHSQSTLSAYACPTSAHWSSATRVLRYLKSSVDHDLQYTKGLFILLPTVIVIGKETLLIVALP
jgi:hypothetical protein